MTTPSYSAENITVLKGLDAVRKRPGMYIGSTGPDGLHHLVYEVVDNCIDEAMAGYCDTILVVLEKNDTVRVEDNGRGIPVDIHPEEGVSALELVLTRLHAGGKFDKGSYKVSGGLHGVGVSVVNALSTNMEAIVCRDGFEYVQKFALGEPLGPVTKRGETQKRGTTIRWTADPTIFTETTTYNFDVLAVRLRELAFLNNTISITLRDERLSTPKEVTFAFDGGISHFVRYLNESKQVLPKEPIYFDGEKSDVVVELAMQYNDGYKENVLSFVNDINTREGGTHLEGFKTALTRVMNEFLKKNAKLSKKMEKEEKLMGEDVRAGLTAVLSVKVPEPQFEGQTKTKLGNSDVRSIVDTFINEKLTLFFEQNPTEIDKILLTASGGPFRLFTKEQMSRVTAADALKHPTWEMGAKITIDSASMMNKGFEVIEAKWLFGVSVKRIQVLVHPQSIVHSAVQFCDGSVKAQLGMPDMRLPIQYAFSFPDRLPLDGQRLDLFRQPLEFFEPDFDKFRCLALAFEAIHRGGNMPCILNAANEIVNEAFRQARCSFIAMADIIEKTMERSAFDANPTYETYIQTDQEARRIAREMVG